MSLAQELFHITGTYSSDKGIKLYDSNSDPQLFVFQYVNSGVGKKRDLDKKSLDFQPYLEPELLAFFQQGSRFAPTRLSMPAGCFDQQPHCHPGGELSYVIDGEYYDLDMHGHMIRYYSKGDLVFYNKGSTHLPGSRFGAEIFYIPFDGIIFGKDPEELARKMIKVGIAYEALEYALYWMVPDVKERNSLLAGLGADGLLI